MVYDFVSFLKSIITIDLDIKDIYIKPYVMVISKTIFSFSMQALPQDICVNTHQ